MRYEEGLGAAHASPDPTKQRAKKTVGLVSLFFPGLSNSGW